MIQPRSEARESWLRSALDSVMLLSNVKRL